MRFAVFCFAAVTGCAPPLAPGRRAASDDVQTPLCSFDVSAPEIFAGAITHPESGLDCVPPEYGDTFAVGFGHDGWRMIVSLARADNAVGETVALDGRRAHMLAQTARSSCTDWRGDVVWLGDLPAWSAFVDATCSDGSVRVVGQWSRD